MVSHKRPFLLGRLVLVNTIVITIFHYKELATAVNSLGSTSGQNGNGSPGDSDTVQSANAK